MSKIKVVQIALTSNDTDSHSEYLDDKGRVWFQTQVFKGNIAGVSQYEWEWKQLELPEEPTIEGMPF